MFCTVARPYSVMGNAFDCLRFSVFKNVALDFLPRRKINIIPVQSGLSEYVQPRSGREGLPSIYLESQVEML